VVAYRYWCNKLYNAIRFASLNFPEGWVPSRTIEHGAATHCQFLTAALTGPSHVLMLPW
jgi:hypothetical protein